MYNEQRMWFDTTEEKIITYKDLSEEYVRYILDKSIEDKEEFEWMYTHPEDYTFDAWLEDMSQRSGGILVEIQNANEFMRRKTNE